MAERDENGAELTSRPVCRRSTQGHQQEPTETKPDAGNGEFRDPHPRVAKRERRMLPSQDRIQRQRDSDGGDPLDQPNKRGRDHALRVVSDSG
jgi:hypothetical protein